MEIWHGQEGVDVYKEIHQNYYNELTHIIFLPGVFYGIFRGVPALLSLVNINYPVTTVLSIMCIYSSYYAYTIDIFSGATAFLTISPYAFVALEHYNKMDNHMTQSLTIAGGSLFIQEVLGHSLFESVNSRLTADYIFNAIMFSPLYYALGVNKIILTLQYYLAFFFFII